MFTVKDNNKAVKQEIIKQFEYAGSSELIREAETVNEYAHGRIENRKIKVLSVRDGVIDFPFVKQIAVLSRTREIVKTGKVQTEDVYLITNLDSSEASAEDILRHKRGYWQIENCLHYVKDFVFNEDRSTIRVGSGPQVISAFRNLAVNICRLLGVPNIKRFVDCLKQKPLSVLQLFGVI